MDLDELLCTICLSQFDKEEHLPLMVPKCGHTFCSKCIQDKLSNLPPDNDFICPEDQTPMKIENRNISEFPQNFTLLRLMEKRTQALSDKQTNSFSRKDRSEKSPTSTRDFSSPVGSPGLNRSSVSLRNSFNQQDMFNFMHADINMCREHGRKLEVVCLEHKCRICANCALFGDHKNHDIKPEEEVLKEIAGRAERLIDIFQVMEKSQGALVEQETADRISDRIKKKCEEVNRIVKQKMNDYVNSIRMRERKILHEISEKFCRMEEGFKQMRQVPQDLQDKLQKWKIKTHDSLVAVTERSERGEIAFDLLEDRANMKNDLLMWGEKFILELERINEVNSRFLENSLRKVSVSFDSDFIKSLETLCIVDVPDPTFFRPNEAYSMSNIRDDNDSTLPLGDIINKSPCKTPKDDFKFSGNKRQNNFLDIDKNERQSVSRSPIKKTGSKYSDKLGILDSDSNSSHFKLDTISDRPGGTTDLEDDNNLLSFEWKDLSTENQLADFSTNFGKDYTIKVNGHRRLSSGDMLNMTNDPRQNTTSKIPSRMDNIQSQGQLGVPMDENQPMKVIQGGKITGRGVSPSKKEQTAAKPPRTKKKSIIKVTDKFEGVVEGIEQGMTESADLTGAELGDQGILALIEQLKDNTTLKSLKLLKNKISDEGGIALANLLYHNHTIQTLNLTQNQLSEKTLDAFIEAVRANGSIKLKSIYFSQNLMSLRNVKSKLKELSDMGVNAVV